MIKISKSLGETPESSHGLGKFLGVGIAILALWSFLSEKTPNKISIAGIKRRKSKRLFYMLDTGKGLTAVARQDVDNIKQSNPNRLHAVWAITADDARALIQSGQGERYTGSTKKLDFAGHLLNCIGWQQVVDKKGKQITRCFIMAPNCKTKACAKQTEELRAKGLKAKAYKKNYPHKKELSGIYTSCQKYYRAIDEKIRCAKYALNCNPEVECATQKAPIPWKAVETKYSEKAIKSVAKMLASEMNQSIDDTKRVMRRIKYHGGIAPYSGGYLQEEYRSIPSKYKNKEGIKLDELAQEMEMDESELVEAIGKAEEARSRLPRKKSRFAVKDLMFEAESYLAKQGSGLQGLGKVGQMTLFGKLPDVMNNIQLSTVGYGRFEDWMQMELDLDPSFGPMSLRWLKEHLSDRQDALLKKQERQSIYSKDQTNYTDILNHIRYLKKGIPSYGPQLLETTLYKIFEMAKTEKVIAPWEETRKQFPESKGQMTLFGKLHPYYYKNTGAKVFVSDDIKYHRGPAFKRVDRYRVEILDENKEHMGTMSNREIEKLLTQNKPAIQSYLFGKLVAKKIAMQA